MSIVIGLDAYQTRELRMVVRILHQLGSEYKGLFSEASVLEFRLVQTRIADHLDEDVQPPQTAPKGIVRASRDPG